MSKRRAKMAYKDPVKAAEYNRQYYAKNRLKAAEYARQYQAKNRLKVAEYRRQYKAKNRLKAAEYNRQYQAKNRLKVAEYARQYYAKNRLKMAEYGRQYKAKNRLKVAEYARQYDAKNIRKSPIAGATTRDRGAAGEHLVISQLLARNLEVGGPYNQNGKHDLFVKLGTWHTVQVKLGRVNSKTGTVCLCSRGRRSSITSDLIAIVDLKGQRVRWMSNNGQPVPSELTHDL
jgi:hypothetical protein